MLRRKKKRQLGRTELIDRKHQIAGEMTAVRAELRRRQARHDVTADLEARLTRLQSDHYQTRLAIDRAEPGS